MRFKIEPRRETSRALVYGTPVLAIALTVVSGFFLFALMGYEPLGTLYFFFVAPLQTLFGLSEIMLKAAPLILIAVGLAMGFKANVWNIGAEGQLTCGAIAGGGVALWLWGEEGLWILPLICFSGILGGLLYAAIPAFLKTRFEVNEILTSLMLSYVATLLLSTLVYGPWKDPMGFNFPQSKMFTDAAILPIILDGTRLQSRRITFVRIEALECVPTNERLVTQEVGLNPGRCAVRIQIISVPPEVKSSGRKRDAVAGAEVTPDIGNDGREIYRAHGLRHLQPITPARHG